MNSITVKITEVKNNPENPRLIKDEKFKSLVQSIKDFPEMMEIRPVVVNKKMMILGGNMRFKAAKEAGLKEIPIIIVDLSEDKQHEFIIKDNVSGGDWDWDKLANEWDLKKLTDWGLDIPDFSTTPEAQEDDFDIPPVVKTDIQPGDIFDIGPHRLICGDSTQPSTFERLFAGEQADMVITDPPYNVDYTGGTKKALKMYGDKQTDSAFYKFLCDFYAALGAFTKPGGAWYVWFADIELTNFARAFTDGGLKLAQMLIWKKNSIVMGRKDYHFKHEPCLYGWREGAAHKWYGDRKQSTVLEFDKPTRNADHPTMKPIPLFAYQITNSSKKGDIVADGFGGSGTTMVACHQLNRKAYLVEYDPKYCQVIIDRMLKLDNDLKIRKNGKIYKPKTAVLLP